MTVCRYYARVYQNQLACSIFPIAWFSAISTIIANAMMSRPNRSTAISAPPAPIIKTRIPIELKTVFIAAQRGEAVTKPPPSASKTFDIWRGSVKVSKSDSDDADSERTRTRKNRHLVFGETNVLEIEAADTSKRRRRTRKTKHVKDARWIAEDGDALSSVDPPRQVSPSTARQSPISEPITTTTSIGRWESVGQSKSCDMPRLPGRKRSSQNVMLEVLDVPKPRCTHELHLRSTHRP